MIISILWVWKVVNFNCQEGKRVCKSVHGDLLSVWISECGTTCTLSQISKILKRRPKDQTTFVRPNYWKRPNFHNSAEKGQVPSPGLKSAVATWVKISRVRAGGGKDFQPAHNSSVGGTYHGISFKWSPERPGLPCRRGRVVQKSGCGELVS